MMSQQQQQQHHHHQHHQPATLPPPAPSQTSSYQPPYGQSYPHHYPPPQPYNQQSGPPPYGHTPHMPLPPMQSAHDPRLHAAGPPPPQHQQPPPPPASAMSYAPSKRVASGMHPNETPAKKKQSKWSAEEDAAIIELRGNGMKWEDISRNLPGRSAISCRLRFQNYLERRSEWDEEKKNKLARLYERFKKDMWEKIAKEMALPWRAAEAMHWQIGEVEMASRANVPVFHLAGYSPSQPAQNYAVHPLPTPLSGSERRSDDSASPHSAENAYPPMATHPDLARDGYHSRLPGGHMAHHPHYPEHDDGISRRQSPRPPTAHDSVASSVTGERENLPAPRHYLSPYQTKTDEGPGSGPGALNGRATPGSGRAP